MCTFKGEKLGLEPTALVRDETPWLKPLEVRDGGTSRLGLGTQPRPEWAVPLLSLGGQRVGQRTGRNARCSEPARSSEHARCSMALGSRSAVGAREVLAGSGAEPSGGGVGALRAWPPRRAPFPAPGRVSPAPQLHPLPPPPARSRLLKSLPAPGGGAEPARRTRQPVRP